MTQTRSWVLGVCVAAALVLHLVTARPGQSAQITPKFSIPHSVSQR